MNKTRLLFGLTALLSLFAIAASPAAAKFVSTNGLTHGPLQLKSGTTPKFTISSKGTEVQVSVTCSELASGEWKIRKSEAKQEEALSGDHEVLSGQFTKCNEHIGSLNLEATVNPGCELQFEQKGTTFTGGVVSTCTITQEEVCTITLPAEAANTGLTTVSAVNITGGVELTSNVTGFKSTKTKCPKAVTGTEGGFVATAIAHSQKVE